MTEAASSTDRAAANGATANDGAAANDGGAAGSARSVSPAASRVEARTYYDLARPVFFVGFMGAGKTSVSRKLARLCGIAAVDMDTYLERREGKKVSDIFAESGEAGFRAIETDVLRELALKDPLLVSCGGGVVVTPENRAILKDAGFVVYLQVSADEAKSRISDLSTRPLFNDIEDARKRNADRRPLYEEVADATIDTAGKKVAALAYEIRTVLQKEGVLCPRQR